MLPAGIVMDMLSMKRTAFETARLALSRLQADRTEGGWEQCMRVAARALDVERVGLWFFDYENRRIVCRAQYLRSTDELISGDVLPADEHRRYWQALQEHRTIVADDAQNDPITMELVESYLKPLNITSLLDAPVFDNGVPVGIVCHEHVGPARVWTQQDIDFSATVADLVATMLAHARHLELEQSLRAQILQLHDAEQLDAVTRIAAAVAHDFRNVFTALGLIAQKLERVAPEMAPTLKSTLNLGHFLTNQLDSFGQRRVDAKAYCDAREVLLRFQPMLELLLRGTAELTMKIPAKPVNVKLPAGALEQTILNLVTNAREAVAPAGIVVVTLHTPNEHDEVVMTVQDDGKGIPADMINRVFDLGYSTRVSGTGLGLSAVRETLGLFDADISADSDVAKGAVLRVVMPAASM
jgi:two-component system, cell cycle sensor histidine kinase and response regulator CckA